MRKIREVLRLKFEVGLSARQAEPASVSTSIALLPAA
ncbi:hypothetical protein J2Y83_003636 [Pseudomonas marginalis]|nr:hypothetical protein [Pseudomonas marginalis]MCP1525167.1 hypothetical protein [Pseudomonas marginalis]MDQ0500238.1 hypothetical protein [Pseudomonas marginalis]